MRTDICSCLGHLQNGCEARADRLLAVVQMPGGLLAWQPYLVPLAKQETPLEAAPAIVALKWALEMKIEMKQHPSAHQPRQLASWTKFTFSLSSGVGAT